MNIENNYINPIVRSKVIRGNISYLTRLSKNVPEGESIDRVNTLIDLYTTRKLTQLTTVEKIIVAYIKSKSAKQRVAINTKFDKIIDKYQEAKPLAERIAPKKSAKDKTEKRNKAASKIQHSERNFKT